MRKSITRRDFLKLSGALSAGLMGYPFLKIMPSASQVDTDGKKNILIIVFDAFSARHISTYGYSRETTPNITRLAERAIVYHNHHAGGNFTTPGTASLLTGTLPWQHRAFSINALVVNTMADKSIFHAFHNYHRIAYSHNPVAVKLLNQFSSGLEENIPMDRFYLQSDKLIQRLFSNDLDTAEVGWIRTIKKDEGYSYSLFLSAIYEYYQKDKFASLAPQFPLGIPRTSGDNYFTLEMIIDWLSVQAGGFPRPFLGYFHLLPPHYPYFTRREFHNVFRDDGFQPAHKDPDLFSEPPISYPVLKQWHELYDEYILYVDREFGRLFDQMERSGLLEDTWVILTSDHGELFERGIRGHATPVLYEPVIHIPLIIFEPGRSTRTDIYAPTSAVDLLPTLLHVTGEQPADWSEGFVLPPFSQEILTPRNIYAVQSVHTLPNEPLTHVTLMQTKEDYKLMYFTGYEELKGRERIELYNLAEDPEEMNNLYATKSGIGKALLDELKSKLSEMNKPYL